MSRRCAPYWPAGTVYGTLLNFHDERAQMAVQMAQPPYLAPPVAPVLYVKTANSWNTSTGVIALPRHVPWVEVGATVAMVMGPRSPGNRSSPAITSVAGYVLMNDLSVPHANFFRPPVKFKCLDGFLPIGAQLLGAEQAGDPASFRLQVRINGQLRQTIDFARLVRGAARLLTDVAGFMSLREADVLMLGCAAGRPLAQAGDLVEISAPGLPAFGALANALVAQSP